MGKSGAKFAGNCLTLKPGSYSLFSCCWFKSCCRYPSASPASCSRFNTQLPASASKALLRKELPSTLSAGQLVQYCMPSTLSAGQLVQYCQYIYQGRASFNLRGITFCEATSCKFSSNVISNTLLAANVASREKFRFLHSTGFTMENRKSHSEENMESLGKLSEAKASDEVAAKRVHQSISTGGLASGTDHANSTESWRANYKESVLVNRKWKLTETGEAYERESYRPSAQDGILEFTVASYNVLAQNLLEDNSYLYAHCSREWLQWPFRWQRLLDELKRYQPDVLCCQEINDEHYVEFFSPELEKLGYKGEFKKRTRQMHDGCATFYKTAVFDCLSVVPIEYFRQGVSALDRDNVAMILVLRPKKMPDTSTQLCVANTHLLFNPRRGDVKLAQLMMLFAEIDKISFRHTLASPSGMTPVYHPTILCGDLNMEPFSQLYRFVSSGNLPFYGVTVQKLSKPIPLVMSTAGQYWEGSDRQLHNLFLDPDVGISDYSQYIEVCRARGVGSEEDGEDEIPPEFVQGSGHAGHRLGLKSVYRHFMDYGSKQYAHRLPEVSTSHTRANCTVDYIFYSSGSANFYDEKLQLLSHLSLLSTQEMQLVGGLPNEFVSSDHLMLSARFVLKMDRP